MVTTEKQLLRHAEKPSFSSPSNLFPAPNVQNKFFVFQTKTAKGVLDLNGVRLCPTQRDQPQQPGNDRRREITRPGGGNGRRQRVTDGKPMGAKFHIGNGLHEAFGVRWL